MTNSQSTTSQSLSSIALPQPPPASVPPQGLVFKGRQWQRIEHAPTKRRGVEQSRIWEHGTDYSCLEEEDIHAWRCLYCFKNYLVVMKQDVTSNARRHLRIAHGISIDNAGTRKRSREEYEADSQLSNSPQIKGLVMLVNIDTFRYYLTRWIVNRHIPFSAVEDPDFQEMLKSLNGSVNDYLVKSGNTVRNWIEDDLIEAKRLIRDEVLARAISKIHISCDLWTSSNGYTMCGIAAHFIGHHGHIQNVLLALRRMTGAHGGEQIAEIIVSVVIEYDFAERLGVYIGDNAESNDTAWKATLNILHPERDPKASRSRCLGHIINLAAKAFIFGKNVEAFEAAVDLVHDSTPWDSQAMRTAQNEWRKRGALGKIHNIIVFIRISSQRREAFKKITVDEIGDGKQPLIL
jgi:hypothetical protein